MNMVIYNSHTKGHRVTMTPPPWSGVARTLAGLVTMDWNGFAHGP